MDLCLLSVKHDKMENVVSEALEKQKHENELIFWEREVTVDDYNINLEDAAARVMGPVFSLVILHVVPFTEWSHLGHGSDTILLSTLKLFANNSSPQVLSFYEHMNENERRIYIITREIHRVFVGYVQNTNAEILHMQLCAFFAGNKQAAEDFAAIILNMLRDIVLIDGTFVDLSAATMKTAHKFANDFCDLLVSHRGQLGLEINAAAELVKEFRKSGVVPNGFVEKMRLPPGKVRDRLNLNRIIAVVGARPNIKRAIVVIGAAHIPRMEALLQEYNKLQTGPLALRFTFGWPIRAIMHDIPQLGTVEEQSKEVLLEVSEWRSKSMGEQPVIPTPMHVEDPRTKERQVDICLLGVNHDELERKVEAVLLDQQDRDDEVIFFERSIRQDGHHLNLVPAIFGIMQVVFSLLVLNLVPQTPWDELGHGDERVAQELDLYPKDHKVSQNFYNKMTTFERRLFGLISSVYRLFNANRRIWSAEIMDAEIGQFFGNDQAAREFATLRRNLMDALPTFDGKYVRLGVTTTPLTRQFAKDVCDLLVAYEGKIRPEMNEAAQLLRQLRKTGRLPADFVTKMLDVPSNVRDSFTMDRVSSEVFAEPAIKRVILVVRSGQVDGLLSLVRQFNAAEGRYLLLRFTLRNAVYADPLLLHTHGTQQDQVDEVLFQVEQWRSPSLDTPGTPENEPYVPSPQYIEEADNDSPMYTEVPMPEEREVTICLLGVHHDPLERLIQSALVGERKRDDDEVIFWEKTIVEDDHNIILEEVGSQGMQFVSSLIILQVLRSTTWQHLGHSHETESLQNLSLVVSKGNAMARMTFALMNTGEKQFFQMYSNVFEFFVRYTQDLSAEKLHLLLRRMFGENEQAAEDFAALLLKWIREIVLLRSISMGLSDASIKAAHVFANDVIDLLVDYEGDLGPDLNKVALLLRQNRETGLVPDEFIEQIRYAVGISRDRMSLNRVVSTLRTRQGINRVILVVGTAHLSRLERLILEHNAEALSPHFLLQPVLLTSQRYMAIHGTIDEQLKYVLSQVAQWRATSI